MNLQQLKFEVDTSEVKQASVSFENLAMSLAKIDKPAAESAKSVADIAKAEAQAAEAAAKAAQAQLALQTAIEKKTKAQNTAGESTKQSVTILQRQTDILGFMTEGFTKGQSTVLAYAKAAGESTDELKKILNVQRELIGGDPFDKSLSGLKSLQNELKVLKAVQRSYGAGVELTSKQVRDLSLDKERLLIRLKQEDASLTDIKSALRALNADYAKTAASVNKITEAEKLMLDQRKQAAAAAKYIADADARLAAALDDVNVGLDKRHTDALVKYENALRRMGLSSEEVATRMLAVRGSFEKLKLKEQAFQMQYLARAMSVQMGDVAISLASGMNPLLVLIQQGDQIRGVIQQVGADTAAMRNVMRDALGQITKSFVQTASVVGSFFMGSIKSAGEAFIDFGFKVFGGNKSLSDYRTALEATAGSAANVASKLRMLNLVIGSIGAGLLAAATAVVGLGVGFYKATKQQDELAKNLALTGGSLNLTQQQAVNAATALKNHGIAMSDALDIISQMAAKGGFLKKEIDLVGKAAYDLQKYANVPIKDTIDSFAKLREKPVEALFELAKATRMVSLETIARIAQLQRQGEEEAAITLAIKTQSEVVDKQTSQMKQNYSGLANAVIDLGSAVSGFFKTLFNDIWYNLTPPKEVLEKNLQNIESRIQKRTEELRKSLSPGVSFDPKEDSVLKGLFQFRERIINQMKELSQESSSMTDQEIKDRKRIEDLLSKISEDSKKLDAKTMTRQDFVAKSLAQVRGSAETTSAEVKILTDYFNKMWNAAQNKTSGKNGKSDLETAMEFFNDLMQSGMGMTKTYQEEVVKLKLLLDQNLITQEAFNAAIDTLIKKQPYMIEYQKQLSKEEKERLKTEKEREEQQKKINKAIEKFREKGLEAQVQIEKENLALDLRESLIGKSTEEAKKLNDEYATASKHLANQLELTREIQDIINDPTLNDNLDEKTLVKRTRLMMEAYDRFTQRQKNINRDVAISAADEMDKEFNRIRDGIADSIETALFEGGKAGRKKLRDLIVAELRKPISVAVKAIVDVVIGGTANLLGITGNDGGNGGNALNSASNAMNLGAAVTKATTAFKQFTNGLTAWSEGGSVTGMFQNYQLYTTSELLGAAMPIIGGALTAYDMARQGGVSGVAKGTIAGMGTAAVGAGVGSIIAGGSFSAGAMAMLTNPWAWGIIAGAAILSAIVNDKSGTPHRGGYAVADILGARPIETDAKFVISETQKAVEDIAFNTVQLLTKTASTFGKQMEYQVRTGFEYDSVDPAWGYFIIQESSRWVGRWIEASFGPQALENVDPEKALKEFTQRSAGVVIAALKDIGLPQWAMEMLNALGESANLEQVAQTVSYIQAVQDALVNLGDYFVNLKDMTGEFATGLLRAFGGIDNLKSAMGYFYENFFSEQEKTSTLLRQVTEGFAALNKPMPATRAEFRALADAAMQAGDANTLAGLMSLQQAFVELTDISAENLGTTIDGLKELVDYLKSTVNELRGGTASVLKIQVQAARDFISQARTAAGQGILPDVNRLSSAVETVTGYQEQARYSTQFEMEKDRLLLANELQGILDVAGPQLTVAEQQLQALTNIGTSASSILSLLQSSEVFAPVTPVVTGTIPNVATVNPDTGVLELSATGGTAVVPDGSTTVVEELRALRNEVTLLRAEVVADVVQNAKTAKILDRVTMNGDTLQVTGTLDGA